MRLFGNIIWHFPFCGFISAAITYLFGLLLTATVVGAPIGLGLMELGKLLFWPFGKAMVNQSDLNITQNSAWNAYSKIVMILYLPFGLVFAFFGVLQVIGSFILVFSIPVGLVVAKSLSTYINPVGKKCVSSAMVAELERQEAQRELARHQGNIQSGATERIENGSPVSTSEAPSKKLLMGGIAILVLIIGSATLLKGNATKATNTTPAIPESTQAAPSALPIPAEPASLPKGMETASIQTPPIAVMPSPAEPVPVEAPKVIETPKATTSSQPTKAIRVSETHTYQARDKAKLRESNAKLDELLKN